MKQSLLASLLCTLTAGGAIAAPPPLDPKWGSAARCHASEIVLDSVGAEGAAQGKVIVDVYPGKIVKFFGSVTLGDEKSNLVDAVAPVKNPAEIRLGSESYGASPDGQTLSTSYGKLLKFLGRRNVSLNNRKLQSYSINSGYKYDVSFFSQERIPVPKEMQDFYGPFLPVEQHGKDLVLELGHVFLIQEKRASNPLDRIVAGMVSVNGPFGSFRVECDRIEVIRR